MAGIALPGYAPAAVDGILKGLQAAKAYYGIDTEKQQAALLQGQAHLSQMKNDEIENFKKTGQLGPLQKLDMGIYDPADFAGGNTGVPGGAPQMVPASVSAQGQAAQIPKIASSDNISSDAGSPLANSIQKISDVTPAASTPVSAQSPSGSLLAGMMPISLPGGKTAYATPAFSKNLLEQQNTIAGINEKRASTAKTQQEIADKPRSISNAYVEKFNTDSADIQNNIQGANALQKQLTSGNKISEQMAAVGSIVNQLKMKRVNGQMVEMALPQDLQSQLDNYVSKASSGHLAPMDIDALNKSIDVYRQGQAQQLKFLGTQRASQMASDLPDQYTPDSAFKKLLPTGTGEQPVNTRVSGAQKGGMFNYQNMTTPQRLEVQGANGKWNHVADSQGIPEPGPLASFAAAGMKAIGSPVQALIHVGKHAVGAAE